MAGQEIKYVYCGDLDKEIKGLSNCCSSCHEDCVVFDYDLIELYLKDGRLAVVCCRVADDVNRLVSEGRL